MSQICTATFGGFACSSVDFSIGLGIVPGSGTLTFADITLNIPVVGTLIISDDTYVVSMADVYAVNPRVEAGADGGYLLSVTIFDRRYLWQWGSITGQYNKQSVKGIPALDVTLSTLIGYCLTALGEGAYTLTNIPTLYPEVNWEFENPANALSELLIKYNLVLGIDINDSAKIRISPYNEGRVMPSLNLDIDIDMLSGIIKPTNIVLVGNRKVVQDVFTALVLVGEDTDGTVKNINDLSYAPTGAGLGGEVYDYELWGKELVASFSNITDITDRELAEKSVFKWYSIDWGVEDRDEILPLLNIISEVVTIEGIDKHDKPYVEGSKAVWDGTVFTTLAKARLADGYQIDKKLGIVKFNLPKVLTYNGVEGPAAVGFIPADIDLTAAYELKNGDEDDFIHWSSAVSGGYGPDYVKKESSITGYYVMVTGSPVLQDSTDVNNYATGVLAEMEKEFITTDPKMIRTAGIWPYGPWGEISTVKWSVGAESGLFTEVQRTLEIPKTGLPKYEERLNARVLKLGLKPELEATKTKGKIEKDTGAGGEQPYAEGDNTDSEPIAFYGKVSKDVVRVTNGAGRVIPAKSIVQLRNFNENTGYWFADDTSWFADEFHAIVPEAIPIGAKGIAFVDGVHCVLKKAGEAVVAGDRVGPDYSAFDAIVAGHGVFEVVSVDNDDLYIRHLRGDVRGSRLFKIIGQNGGGYGKYSATLQYIDTSVPSASGVSRLKAIPGVPSVTVYSIGEDATTVAAGELIGKYVMGYQVKSDIGVAWGVWSPKYAWWEVRG